MAIDGNIALIGAPGHNHLAISNGAVYFHKFDGTVWVEAQELLASDGVIGNPFGSSVALDGDNALIGAAWEDENGGNSGAVYFFRLDDSEWIETQKLFPSDGQAGAFFGWSIAIAGDVAVIGAPQFDGECEAGPSMNSGSAYVFRLEENTSQWVEEQELIASDCAFADSFGRSVAISDDVILVGAHGDDDNGFGSGSAYVWRYVAATSEWVQEQKLLASEAAGDEQFGRAVAISGDLAVIGAFGSDHVDIEMGAAYLFRFDGASWVEQDLLLPDPGPTTAFFGWSVALHGGSTALIGAHGEGAQSGAVYVFSVLDLDDDGLVGIVDLVILLAAWGTDPGGPPDFDGDGNVGISDLLELLPNWGPCQ